MVFIFRQEQNEESEEEEPGELSEQESEKLEALLNDAVTSLAVQAAMSERQQVLKLNLKLFQEGKLDERYLSYRSQLKMQDGPKPHNLPRSQLWPGVRLGRELQRPLEFSQEIFKGVNVLKNPRFSWPMTFGTPRYNPAGFLAKTFLAQLESLNRLKLLTGEPLMGQQEVFQTVVNWIKKYNTTRTPENHIYDQSAILAKILTVYPV